MLKLEIKSTFQNTTPKDARWPVCFIASSFSPWKFVDNRKIRVTFYSRSFRSCRIFRICIFIISWRAYITYSDRWSGSQVSAGYMTSHQQTQLLSRTSPENHATILTWYAIQNQENIATSPYKYVPAPTFIILVRPVGVSMWIFISKIGPFHDLSTV